MQLPGFLTASYSNPITNRLIKNENLKWWQPTLIGFIAAVALAVYYLRTIPLDVLAAMDNGGLFRTVSILLLGIVPLVASVLAVLTTSLLLDDVDSYRQVKLSAQSAAGIASGLITGALHRLRFLTPLLLVAYPVATFGYALLWTDIRIELLRNIPNETVVPIYSDALSEAISITTAIVVVFFLSILLGIAARTFLRNRFIAIAVAVVLVSVYGISVFVFVTLIAIDSTIFVALVSGLAPSLILIPALYFVVLRRLKTSLP